MNINEITVGEAKELAAMFGNGVASTPFEVGKAYLIRTVTYFITGRVVSITGNFMVLNTAAWVADTGRFCDALNTGVLNEVEPMPDGTIVALTAIVDAAPWAHDLPTEQK